MTCLRLHAYLNLASEMVEMDVNRNHGPPSSYDLSPLAGITSRIEM
jgi:hypothetical protein